MPSSQRAPTASTAARRHSRSRSGATAGLVYSPQGFGRGKCALSASTTAQPARASRSAQAAPAGPAPTTTTSAGRAVMGSSAPFGLERRAHGAEPRGLGRRSRRRSVPDDERQAEERLAVDTRSAQPGGRGQGAQLGGRVGAQHRQRGVVARQRVGGAGAAPQPGGGVGGPAALQV